MTAPTILILGGGGLLGQALVRAMAGSSLAAAAPPRRVLDAADGFALAAVMRRLRPAVVVNAAAFTGVDLAETERAACRRANAGAAGEIAHAAADAGAGLIHISSDFVFDGTARSPYTEDAPVNPVNWYGETKAEGERMVAEAHPHHLILRTAWLHGAGRPCFLGAIAGRLASGGAVEAVADRRASPTGADDLAEAVARLTGRLAAGEAMAWGVYHLAGEGGASPHDIAAVAAAELGVAPGRVTAVSATSRDERARRPAYAVLDTSRARERLGVVLPDWRAGVLRSLGRIRDRDRRAA